MLEPEVRGLGSPAALPPTSAAHLENRRCGLGVLTGPFLMSHEQLARDAGAGGWTVWRNKCCHLTTEVALSPDRTSCDAATLTAAQTEASEPTLPPPHPPTPSTRPPHARPSGP